jgi:hypothetical protein
MSILVHNHKDIDPLFKALFNSLLLKSRIEINRVKKSKEYRTLSGAYTHKAGIIVQEIRDWRLSLFDCDSVEELLEREKNFPL